MRRNRQDYPRPAPACASGLLPSRTWPRPSPSARPPRGVKPARERDQGTPPARDGVQGALPAAAHALQRPACAPRRAAIAPRCVPASPRRGCISPHRRPSPRIRRARARPRLLSREMCTAQARAIAPRGPCRAVLGRMRGDVRRRTRCSVLGRGDRGTIGARYVAAQYAALDLLLVPAARIRARHVDHEPLRDLDCKAAAVFRGGYAWRKKESFRLAPEGVCVRILCMPPHIFVGWWWSRREENTQGSS